MAAAMATMSIAGLNAKCGVSPKIAPAAAPSKAAAKPALPRAIVPAVQFNILQPALRESKGVVVAAAGGLAAWGMMLAPEASAAAEAARGDNRGTLLLFVITPAVLWVLYNILQPALNQLNRMKSD